MKKVFLVMMNEDDGGDTGWSTPIVAFPDEYSAEVYAAKLWDKWQSILKGHPPYPDVPQTREDQWPAKERAKWIGYTKVTKAYQEEKEKEFKPLLCGVDVPYWSNTRNLGGYSYVVSFGVVALTYLEEIPEVKE